MENFEDRRLIYSGLPGDPVHLDEICDESSALAVGNKDLHDVQVSGIRYAGERTLDLGNGHSFVMDDYSYGQFASAMKGQTKYWDMFPDISDAEGVPSRQEQINYLLQTEANADRTSLVRANEESGLLRAFLGPRYAVIDNRDVLQAIHQIQPTSFELEVLNFTEGRKSMYLDLIERRGVNFGTDARPDIHHFGMRVVNSEVGFRKLMIVAYFWRLVCTNGMILYKLKGRPQTRRHVGDMSQDALFDFIGNAFESILEDRERGLSMLGESREAELRIPDGSTIENYIERELKLRNVTSPLITRIQEEYGSDSESNTGLGHSRFRVIQAITTIAGELENEDARHELEAVAGHYLAAA